MRALVIFSLLLAATSHAADTPNIKVLTQAALSAKIVVSNPTDAPIYFAAPPGQNPESIEILRDAEWVPSEHPWCGVGYGFIKLPAGGSVTYEVHVASWELRGATKFRVHVWYVSEAGMKNISEHHLERVHVTNLYSDPIGN